MDLHDIPAWTGKTPDASTPKLLSSYLKAPGKDLTPLRLDRTEATADFSGRFGNYTTTLTGCPCGSRPKPCKHMYRLAMELGLMKADLQQDVTHATNRYRANEVGQLSFQAAVGELENYAEEVQKEMVKLLRAIRYISSGSYNMALGGAFRSILTSPLFECERRDPEEYLSVMRKKDIMAILEERGVCPEEKMTKAELIHWCLNNIPGLVEEFFDVDYKISCAPAFRGAVNKTFTYLCRKYETETHCVLDDSKREEILVKFPFGTTSVYGKDSDESYLIWPDDEITDLLLQYGHDRLEEYNGIPTAKILQALREARQDKK